MEPISINDFAKCDIRIGTIISAEKVENADKLFRLSVDLGEENPRIIVSGIAPYFSSPEGVIGKQVPVIANLLPRTIRGIESQGMILYAVGDGFLKLLSPGENVPSGTQVR